MSPLDKTHEELGLIVLGDAMGNPDHLAVLVETCQLPLHRWFHDERQKILALAMDAIAAGTIAHDQGAVMGYLSRMRWMDAKDAIKGRAVVLSAGIDGADTAMAGASIASLLGDAAGARSMNGLTFGPPRRAVSILRNLAQRRILMSEMERTAANLAKVAIGEDATPIICGMMETLRSHASATGDRSIGDALTGAIGLAERSAELRALGRGIPITWGVSSLDQALPLRIGRVVVLSARPGGGKTSLALQAAHATSAALGRRSVALLSLEMTGEELAMILACRDAQVPRRQAEEAWETILEADRQELRALAKAWTHESAMWIRDASAGSVTGETIVSWIRAQKNRHHGALELVVIDYLGLIKSSNPRASLGDRVGEITSALKQAAISEGVCILLLAQLTREGRKPARGTDGKNQPDPEPRIEDLFGGSSIENDADAILFLHPVSGEIKGRKPINGIIGKNRKGPVGTVPLAFFTEHQHFQAVVPEVHIGRQPIDHDQRMQDAVGVF